MKKQMIVVALALAGAVWMKGILAQETAKPAEPAPAVAAAPAASEEAAPAEAEAPKEISGVEKAELGFVRCAKCREKYKKKKPATTAGK